MLATPEKSEQATSGDDEHEDRQKRDDDVHAGQPGHAEHEKGGHEESCCQAMLDFKANGDIEKATIDGDCDTLRAYFDANRRCLASIPSDDAEESELNVILGQVRQYMGICS